MPTQTTPRDFPAELKEARKAVEVITQNREKLLREEATEAQKVKEAQSKLIELGIADAAALSIEDLELLEAEHRTRLETELNKIQEQIAEGERVMAAYEALSD